MIEDIISVIEERYPNSKYKIVKRDIRDSSIIFILEDSNTDNKLLVKYYKNGISANTDRYKFQEEFYRAQKNSSIVSCPKLISLNEKYDISIMEYIEGENIKNILLKYGLFSRHNKIDVIKSAATALAIFHRTFSRGCSVTYKHDTNFYQTHVLKNHIEVTEEELDDLTLPSLNSISTSFIDYSPPNILISDSMAYLVDFPKRTRLSTPHLDISRFKFYLRLMEQHPYFRILGLSWWSSEELFRIFLDKYCNTIGKEYNNTDMYIIDKLQKEFTIELQKRFSDSSLIREKFIRYYLSDFIHSILNEGLEP